MMPVLEHIILSFKWVTYFCLYHIDGLKSSGRSVPSVNVIVHKFQVRGRD